MAAQVKICRYAFNVHLAYPLKRLDENHSCYLCVRFRHSPKAMAKAQRETLLLVVTPAIEMNGA